ncbi:MAG: DUF4124 domain-containing protein [Azoarcus sp.]|jgi:hypothetical protein|nr:DUF4124 domain-containing protein [Azoarcus sp.]
MISSRVIPLFLLALVLAPLSASAQVYKCIEDNGRISYTNNRGNNKKCTALDNAPAVSSLPASSFTRPQVSFPKVSSDTQRERDKARRQVLENELADETAALEEAKRALAEQEGIRLGGEKNYQRVLDRLQPYRSDVERRERNIEALNKEISGLR